MRIRTILFIFVLLISLLYVTFKGSSANNQLANAYARYTEGERATTISVRKEAFNESLELYKALDNSYSLKYGNGKLYFNIANCYFQLEQYPWAIYYYNRSQALRPRDSKVTQNLHIAQMKLGVSGETKESKSIFGLSLPERLQLFFVFSLIVLAFASLQIWFNSPFWKTITLFFGLIVTILFLNLIYAHYFGPVQGILVNSASLYRDAGEQYAKVSEKPLLSGIEVNVLGTQDHGAWLKVQTSEGDIGFIQKDALRIIDTQ